MLCEYLEGRELVSCSLCLNIHNPGHMGSAELKLPWLLTQAELCLRLLGLQIALPSLLVFMTLEGKLAQVHGPLALPAAPFSWEDNTKSSHRCSGQKRKLLCSLNPATVFWVLKMMTNAEDLNHLPTPSPPKDWMS